MRKLQGFILVELAIALCILGCLGSIIFPLIKTSLMYKRLSATQHNCDAVLRALAVYRVHNNRLPCPGENGVEIYGRTIGEVPYKDLFLEKKTASDGNGNVLLYAVDSLATTAMPRIGLEDSMADDYEEFTNAIQIFDEYGELVTPAAYANGQDFCAVVLMSIPTNLTQQLSTIIAEDGDIITIRCPPQSSGVAVRWMSSNNLDVLNR
ncbi:MAG: hypothetical protein LBF84_01795 [Holosporales bacterium]|jgi:type II secretory pathway pseudopilin PulG|nr:hypothetical protein [Holosporales bacterium]